MIASETPTFYAFTANGVQTQWTVNLEMPDSSWLEVYNYPPGNILDENQDYTVTVNPTSVTVTFLATPAADVVLTFLRRPVNTQELTLPEGTSFPTESLEDHLDKVTRSLQYIEHKLGLTLRLPGTNGTTVTSPLYAEDYAGMVIGFDDNGALTPYAPDAATSAPIQDYVQDWTGTGNAPVAPGAPYSAPGAALTNAVLVEAWADYTRYWKKSLAGTWTLIVDVPRPTGPAAPGNVTIILANDAARAASSPAAEGLYAYQTDTNDLYIATGTSPGNYRRIHAGYDNEWFVRTQAELTTALAAGGTINIQANIALTAVQTLSVDGTVIQGIGTAARLSPNYAGYALSVNAADCVIRDLYISAAKATYPGNGGIIFHTGRLGHRCLIQNVRIHDTTYGVLSSGSGGSSTLTGVKIRDCRLTSIGDSAIKFEYNHTDHSIYDTVIDATTQHGIYLGETAYRIKISRCEIANWSSTYAAIRGVTLADGASGRLGLEISDCTIRSSAGRGIHLTEPFGVLIRGNRFYDMKASFIHLTAAATIASHSLIEGNLGHTLGEESVGAAVYFVTLWKVSNVTVTGNHFSLIDPAASYASRSGVIIQDGGSCAILSNTFRAPGDYGVIASGTGVGVSALNFFDGNSSDTSTKVTLTSNTAKLAAIVNIVRRVGTSFPDPGFENGASGESYLKIDGTLTAGAQTLEQDNLSLPTTV